MAFFTSILSPHFLFTTDPSLVNIPAVHTYISTRSYWGQGTPLSVVEQGIKNSLFIGVYDVSNPQETRQVGGGRWITDYATFAYMSDVYIEDEFQGRWVYP
ncbi:hypothetical protein K440DRAFT_611966 [Wilcoxina mikolae CBS 423.85]|nr:hypothetical protein K440DRAFT_611966 [Wilcoxina mikolae CBS 423.85]